MSGGKLLDAWLAPEDAGPPIACIATTFTFQPAFFEEDCLSRFLEIDSALLSGRSDADSLVYVLEREERLSDVKVAVLVERGNAQAPPTHRWDVIPVTAGNGGVQHAKVSLLVWREAMRVIVASANLSEAGYRSNVEVFFVLDHPGDELALPALHDTLDFLEVFVTQRTSGSAAPASPRGRSLSTLGLARGRMGARPSMRRSGRRPALRLLHSLDEGRLLERCFDAVWHTGSRPTRYSALSPYFDRQEPVGLDSVSSHLSRRGPVSGEIGLACFKAGEDQVRVRAPRALSELDGRGAPTLRRWPGTDEHSDRVLHAKAYLFEGRDRTMLVAGSANATSAGLGLGSHRNMEAVIALADAQDGDLADAVIDWLPSFDEIPSGTRVYDALELDEVDDVSPPLPSGFVEALYEPAARTITITIEPAKLPIRWTIVASDGSEWFTEADVSDGEKLVRELGEEVAPTKLAVEWEQDEERLVAELIVSVADASQLPDPPELLELTLQELLELLAVGGRLHALLVRLVSRRLGAIGGPSRVGPEIDPHRKVDTSDFILQRMRHAAHALEGLRERLEQPVSHPDALARRLRGPFGPLGLARALERAGDCGEIDKRELSFILAELALVLHRTAWQPVGALVSQQDCEREARTVMVELHPKGSTGDKALDHYVDLAFSEAMT